MHRQAPVPLFFADVNDKLRWSIALTLLASTVATLDTVDLTKEAGLDL
jgi:hypothetical protein